MPAFDKWTGRFFSGVGLLIIEKDIEGNNTTILFRHPKLHVYSLLGGPCNNKSMELNECCTNKVRELSSNLVNINNSVLNYTSTFDLPLENGNFYRLYILTLKKNIDITTEMLIKNQTNIRNNMKDNANKIENWMYCDKILKITVEELKNNPEKHKVADELTALLKIQSKHTNTLNKSPIDFIDVYKYTKHLKIKKIILQENVGPFSNTNSWVIRKKQRNSSKSRIRKSKKKRNREKSHAKRKS